MSDMRRISDIYTIKNILEDKSKVMIDYVSSNLDSNFILYYKYLTHSDLPTFGKATRVNRLEDNLLYYLTIKEMVSAESRSGKPFETAHQSNIGLPIQFWEDIDMLNPRETVNMHDDYKKINNYINVSLVNETMTYFNGYYTRLIFQKLGKNLTKKLQEQWSDENSNVILNGSEFTELELTQAVHGIGITQDIEFRKLRHNMFKNDLLFLLIEKSNKGNNLFIIPIKNPRFFTLIGQTNLAWEQYQIRENERINRLAYQDSELIEQISSRQYQDRWRNQLAEEMMNFTTNEREVFCPLTFISADFDKVGTLYRASHIKGFADCTDDEKYDLNNGLLLIANADALFDKHMITIDENKNLVFSFLLDQNSLLKQKLFLNNHLFTDILNESRMNYLSIHRKKFYEKEEMRRRY